jgi:hypothetical protein
MSAQGGTLKAAPIHVPMRPVVATVLAVATALGIGLGVRELVQEPARTRESVAQLDWGSQLGHPQLRDRNGSAEVANADGLRPGYGSHQQR